MGSTWRPLPQLLASLRSPGCPWLGLCSSLSPEGPAPTPGFSLWGLHRQDHSRGYWLPWRSHLLTAPALAQPSSLWCFVQRGCVLPVIWQGRAPGRSRLGERARGQKTWTKCAYGGLRITWRPPNWGLLYGELRSGTRNTCSGEHQAGLLGCGRSCHQWAEGAGHGGLTQWGRCTCGDHPGEGCPGLAGLLLALDCAWLLTSGADTHMWRLVGRRQSSGHPSPLTGKHKERLGQQGGQLSQCGGWVRTVLTPPCPSAPQGSPAQGL